MAAHSSTNTAASDRPWPVNLAFLDDDDDPIPTRYQVSNCALHSREQRAMSLCERLLQSLELPGLDWRIANTNALHELVVPDRFAELQAKVIALQRFLRREEWRAYEQSAATERGRKVYVFVPDRDFGEGRFFTLEEFRVEAGKHRWMCKCGLPNNGLLDLLQTAFTQVGEWSLDHSPAYKWYVVHQTRDHLYRQAGGIEAPVWDPFPDGRDERPRCDPENERDGHGQLNEQGQQRQRCWRANRGRLVPLSDSELRQDAWSPAHRLPSGPPVNERQFWTPEQEHEWRASVEREQQRKAALRASLLAEYDTALSTTGVQHLPQPSESAAPRSEPSARSLFVAPEIMLTSLRHSSAPETAASSSRVGFLGHSSSERIASSSSEEVTRNSSVERVASSSPETDQSFWFTMPERGRKPLAIVNPADNSVVDTKPGRE